MPSIANFQVFYRNSHENPTPCNTTKQIMGRIWFLNFQLSNSHYCLISILWFSYNLAGSHAIIWHLLDSHNSTIWRQIEQYIKRYIYKKNKKYHLPFRELNPSLLVKRQVSQPLDHPALLSSTFFKPFITFCSKLPPSPPPSSTSQTMGSKVQKHTVNLS